VSLTRISPVDETSVTPAPASPPGDTQDLLAGLDPEQREVAETLHGPVCVLAGAGTGKTRAITYRIAHGVRRGVYAPQRVLAVTFTTRAAGEMRDRLRSLGAGGVQARTFHSAALRQLKYFWPQVVGGELPRLVASKAPLVAEAASRQRLRPDVAVVRDLAAEIEWAKVSRVSADDYAVRAAAIGRAVAATDAATVARVYAAYDEIKRTREVLDFEDVLLLTVAMLEDAPLVAEQVRAQYHHFVVDEYQDVNPLQQRLLELWLGARTEICVVGDPSQTIYSFAGASPSYLLDFPRSFAGAKVVRLERDYRSTAEVVALANGLLDAATGPSAAHRLRLRSQIGAGPAPTFSEHSDEPAEAAGVAARIAGLVAAGTPAREVAVLFRINAQSAVYEQALSDVGVPYVVRGGDRFFERPEVRQAITLLRGAARGEADRTDSALSRPGAGDVVVDALRSTGSPSARAESREPGGAGLSDRVRDVLASAGWTVRPPAGSGAVRARWESLSALVQLTDDVVALEPAMGFDGLVRELQARAEAQHAPTADAVTLATLHAAKGLEWDAVFVVGLADGTVPLVYAEDDAAIEEERRLLYVGVTRARQLLGLSWALARSPGGRASRRPSRFLDSLRPVAGRDGRSADPTPERRGPRRSARAASCRTCGRSLASGAERKTGRCAECPSTYDDAIFDSLREWRSRSAREQSVPAFCVFTDATLVAIAETLPVSERELSQVPGVGAAKLQRYAGDVLGICAGKAP